MGARRSIHDGSDRQRRDSARCVRRGTSRVTQRRLEGSVQPSGAHRTKAASCVRARQRAEERETGIATSSVTVDCKAQRRSTPPPSPDPKCMSISAPNLILGAGMTMQELADALAGGSSSIGSTDRIVVNRTELPGAFDFLLRWSPPPGPDGERSNQSLTPVPPQAPDWLREAIQRTPPSNGASLFTAIPEQLGLKLEPRDELLDVIVIDHIEQPTPN
ncbi:MAG TPA: TIGR03435 family protein [Vicinamibacterales bacterium]|nr:TIGR03435 family protein [Vicinamibacterales bacterium]